MLGERLLGFSEPQLIFDLALHMGTLIATLVFFRGSFAGMAVDGVKALGDKRAGRRWSEVLTSRPNARLLWLVIVGSVPTAVFGLVFKDQLTSMFGDARATAWQLLMTAGLLLATGIARGRGRDLRSMHLGDALLIGLAQGISIVPGISRSGATIATGLLLGLDRELAARYSFVLSVPAIGGAFAIEALHAGDGGIGMLPLLTGFAVSLVSGLLALAFLMPVVRRGRVYLFALYLIPASLGALWVLP